MNAPRKPTAVEAWRMLQALSDDDEAERDRQRILALKPEELDEELAAAGIDPAESRARARAFAKLVAKTIEPASKELGTAVVPHPLRPRRRPFSRTGVVLLLAAALALLGMLFRNSDQERVGQPPPPHGQPGSGTQPDPH
jgi:hypothetical protein